MASDRYTNATGAAATLLLWGQCTVFSLREAGVTLCLRTVPRPRLAATPRQHATPEVPARG